MKFARCRIEWKPRDWRIGVSWETDRATTDLWICFLPCLPLHVTLMRRGALDRELRFYRSHLDDLLGAGDVNEGKHVVIQGADIAGVCDTFDEALRVGYGKYGLGPFLVKKIERVETVHRFSRDLG